MTTPDAQELAARLDGNEQLTEELTKVRDDAIEQLDLAATHPARNPSPETHSQRVERFNTMTDDEAVTVLNAWRRLAAFVALIDGRDMPSEVRDLVREFVDPAMIELNRLADHLPAEQLNATLQAPSAWFPNLREARWHRTQPRGGEGENCEGEREQPAVEARPLTPQPCAVERAHCAL